MSVETVNILSCDAYLLSMPKCPHEFRDGRHGAEEGRETELAAIEVDWKQIVGGYFLCPTCRQSFDAELLRTATFFSEARPNVAATTILIDPARVDSKLRDFIESSHYERTIQVAIYTTLKSVENAPLRLMGFSIQSTTGYSLSRA